ncbi:CARDB domain-containing protein [Paenibacillus sp. D51F]
MKNFFVILLLLSFITSDISVFSQPVSAASSDTFTSTFSSTNNPGYQKFYPSQIINDFNINVPQYQSFDVKSYSIKKNGLEKGQLGSYNKAIKKIEIPQINGDPINVDSAGISTMYFSIWRDSSGRNWRTGKSSTGDFIWSAPSETITGGVSQYPGLIPSTDNSGKSIPLELRYSDGSAASWSDKIPPPDSMFTASQEEVSISKIDPKSINITQATPSTRGLVIDYKGKGADGYGFLKVHKQLSANYNFEGIDYRVDNSLGGNVQGRDYLLDSNTVWSGVTYLLEYEVTVTYERIGTPTKPDLIADDITGPTAIEVGKSATFTATYHNEGLDINKAFNVKVTDEKGATLKLDIKPSIKSGESASLTFTSTFTANTSKTFKLTVDSGAVIDESNENNNTVQRTFTPGATPTPTPTPNKEIKADFDVLPSSIDYGDSFTVHPKDLQLGSCTYTGHMYKYVRGSNESVTGWFSSYSDTSYTRSDYPRAIGQGNHQVYMKVLTDCGATDWIGPKPLEVKGPKNNHPPTFKIAWVKRGEPTKPVRQAMEGDILDLVVIQDPSIPTPNDPDGDDFIFDGFDYTRGTPWIKSLNGKYPTNEWGMYEVRMEKGTHTVYGTGRDQWGATAEASTFINVLSRSPIPIIKCPATVIENHFIPSSSFDSSGSYSPDGTPIDHSRDEWQNKLTSYANGTGQDIIVQVQLAVYDTKGRRSDAPAVCDITVKPDIPPVAKLDVPTLGIRNEPNIILNKSYSPDGDEIVTAKYKYKYDALNNGFADDPWQTLTGTLKQVTFAGSKVGKYLFWTEVTEDYGLTGNTDNQTQPTLTLNIVNNAPEVSFDLKGKNPQPDLDASTTIRPEKMLEWPVYVPNTLEQVYDKLKLWSVDGGSLVGGEGRNFGGAANNMNRYEMNRATGNDTVFWTMGTQADNGFGPNSLSPWRALTNKNTFNDIILDKDNELMQVRSDGNILYNHFLPQVYSTKKLTIFSGYKGSSYTIYGLNPKKLSPVVWDYSNPYSPKRKWTNGSPYEYMITIDNAYRKWFTVSGTYLYLIQTAQGEVRVAAYNVATGQLVKERSFTSSFDGTVAERDKSWGSFDEWKISRSGNDGTIIFSSFYNNHSSDYTLPDGGDAGYFVKLGPDLSPKRLGTIKSVPLRPGTYWTGFDYHIADEWYTDPYGNTYTYEGHGTKITSGQTWNPIHSYLDLTVNKYDSNMNLVWKKYLNEINREAGLNRNQVGFYRGMTTLNYHPMTMSPSTDDLYVPLVQNGGSTNIESSVLRLSMRDGTIKEQLPAGTSTFLDWNGNRTGSNTTLTADNANTGGDCNAYGCAFFREYTGNGVLFEVLEPAYPQKIPYVYMAVGNPTTGPLARQTFTNGQMVSDVSLNDAEMKFSLRMTDVDVDQESMGFSFRMQDPRNRYAIETDGHSFDLVKYVNGSRSVLQSGSYPFQSDVSYGLKVKTVGNNIEAFLNNIPTLSATDGQFTEGKFGYYANKAYVRFSALTYKAVENKVEWSADYAIWDEGTARADVQYENIQFFDPEGDPRAGSYLWSFEHTPRFLNNQSLSALNGRTFESEQLTFDKVGDYLVRLQAKDDPHPDYRYPDDRFGEYRKDSNPFIKKVTVHRRPVSQFTVSPAADGKVIWTDSSYDPDRYVSSTNFSTENTGIDYWTTKGILEKKFYYVTPSGETVYQKLVTPQERGIYEVGMAVKDEYGAWSAYSIQTVNIGVIPAHNTPPIPGFNQTYMSTFRGVSITFDSTAYDKEDGSRENLPHTWYLRNATTNGGESIASSSRTSWQKTFSSLGLFRIRQLVQDSSGSEAQMEKQVTILNRLPSVMLADPASKDQLKPTEMMERKPLFRFVYSDSDQDVQTRFQLIVYRYGGEKLFDSSVLPGTANSWRPNSDLPEGVYMYIQVRVFDGFDWSAWSDPGYFWIKPNRPPIAEFDWSPKPTYEGDSLVLLDRSSDPDGDPLTETWEIASPSGQRTIVNSASTIISAEPGMYRVRLVVSDGKLQSEITKQIQVLPLTLTGDIEHTSEWRRIHADAGHAISGNPKDFYAGEKWIVYGYVSPAPVRYVTAYLRAVGKDGGIMETRTVLKPTLANTVYSGEMHHAQWGELDSGLEKGLYSVQFEVQYENGVRKKAEVPLRIIGYTAGAAGVHRQQ